MKEILTALVSILCGGCLAQTGGEWVIQTVPSPQHELQQIAHYTELIATVEKAERYCYYYMRGIQKFYIRVCGGALKDVSMCLKKNKGSCEAISLRGLINLKLEKRKKRVPIGGRCR
jgi:hypothetical protein